MRYIVKGFPSTKLPLPSFLAGDLLDTMSTSPDSIEAKITDYNKILNELELREKDLTKKIRDAKEEQINVTSNLKRYREFKVFELSTYNFQYCPSCRSFTIHNLYPNVDKTPDSYSEVRCILCHAIAPIDLNTTDEK